VVLFIPKYWPIRGWLAFDPAPGDKNPAELFSARSENTGSGYNHSLFPVMKLDKVIKNIVQYFTLIWWNLFLECGHLCSLAVACWTTDHYHHVQFLGWAYLKVVLTLPHYPGHLRGLAVACRTTDHYHPCSNPGVGISEGCFVFCFTSLPLEVAQPI